MSNLVWRSARDLVSDMATGALSAVEVMNAFYDQIEKHNPQINAIVNLIDRDAALRLAGSADAKRQARAPAGPLHGLPLAVKDLVDAKGFATTFGYRPFADSIAQQDALVVARMRAAGGLVIGKTNVPEFGLGSHTYNDLFGTTSNPYVHDRTAGGSSGGAAAALACGMLPVADASSTILRIVPRYRAFDNTRQSVHF